MGQVLIINADDLGYDPEVNRGILEAMKNGVVTSATLMVNTPHSEEAARAARGLAIGLHFNLTRYPPLWKQFPPLLLTEGRLNEALAPQLPPEVVEQEALAQLNQLERLLGARPTHLDVHKHLHLHPGVLGGVARAAARRKLPVRSINTVMRRFLHGQGVKTNEHFLGDAGTEAYWTQERLAERLRSLPAQGSIELMCHPGYAPSTVKSGYHHQREVELATFTSAQARQLLEGIELGDFRAL